MNPNNNNIYDGLEYTTKQINSSFKMKVFGKTKDGQKINTLVGVSGLVKLVGTDLANSFVDRAFNTVDDDKCICRLRRGIKITFYNH
jgi:hypothetical protein